MKARLVLSWFFLLAGAAWGARLSYSGRASGDPLVSALSGGYLLWALYWGVPVVFRWWMGLDFGREWQPRLLKFLLGSLLVPLFSHLYGVFGGGLYQCLKTWWRSRS
jgi:hypothetical protein